MTSDTLLLFAVALAINSGSPGPSIAALVSRVLHSGWRSVLPFLAAMWIGEALWMGAAIAGLSAIAQSLHPVFFFLKYAGLAYLLYLAYRMWTASPKSAGEELPATEKGWQLLASGMAVTIGNPKIMVFYLALLPALVSISSIGAADWLQLTLILVVVLAVIDLSWVFMAHIARGFLRSPNAVGISNRISAVMMAGAAVLIASRN